MKTPIYKFSGKVAFFGALLATANLGMAQSSITTTTTSAGTVREFSPEALTIASDPSAPPVRYTYSKTTQYVDENGNPVETSLIRSGAPVTVYYDRNGDQLTATKVVVRKSIDTGSDGSTTTTTATSTTSSQGMVSSLNPDAIVIRSDSASVPQSYSFSKTTTYVDENGNPVSIDTVRSGAPVTVFYDHDGDRLVATRVVVRNSDPNAAVVEHKKTTTTTTETNPNP